LVPKATVIAVLVNPTSAQAPDQTRDAEDTARAMGLQIRVLNASAEGDFEQAFSSLAGVLNAALLVSADPLFVARRERLVALAHHHAIPAIYGRREVVVAGGLVSYGADLTEPYRLLGTYAGRILKGEKPSDLPVMQPTKFEFVINLQTARTLGIEVPATLLATADEVIE
jgi:putative ABC transport system substrate-binding protein